MNFIDNSLLQLYKKFFINPNKIKNLLLRQGAPPAPPGHGAPWRTRSQPF
jgi:hypothetical protein